MVRSEIFGNTYLIIVELVEVNTVRQNRGEVYMARGKYGSAPLDKARPRSCHCSSVNNLHRVAAVDKVSKLCVRQRNLVKRTDIFLRF